MRIYTLIFVLFALNGCSQIYNRVNLTLVRVTVENKPVLLGDYVALNPDCSLNGEAIVRVLEQGKYGQAVVEKGKTYTQYHRLDPMSYCNTRQTDAIKARYIPSSNYKGRDRVTIEVILSTGEAAEYTFHIDVR